MIRMEEVETTKGESVPVGPYRGDYFDDDIVPRVRLEQELNINDLRSGGGTEFAIDGSDLPPEYEDMEYKNDEVYKYLNPEFGDEEGSEESGSYEDLAKTMEDVSPYKDNGVMKTIKLQGTGGFMSNDAFVTIHYNAYLEGIDEPFDSTYLRSRPVQFPLGGQTVVPGLDIAVRTMKKGEISRYLFQPDYFLGPSGCPPRIPGDTTVMFVVELKKWEESGGADEYYRMTRAEKREATFKLVGKVALREKGEGNDHYHSGRWVPALRHYYTAIRLAEDCRLQDEIEEKSQRKFLFALYKNAALAGLKLCRYKSVLANMGKALEYDANDAKCLYLKGRALHGMGQTDQAKTYLQRANTLKPGSKDIANALRKLESDVEKFKLTERDLCARMFKFNGTSDDNTETTQAKPKKKKVPTATLR